MDRRIELIVRNVIRYLYMEIGILPINRIDAHYIHMMNVVLLSLLCIHEQISLLA